MKMRTWLLVPILTFLPAPALQAQQLFDFDGLAREIAPLFQSASANSSAPSIVLVSDFDETHATSSELGPELANEFAASLRKYAQGFVVLRPSELRLILADHDLPESAATYPPAIKCRAHQIGISTIIEGGMEYGGGGVVLNIYTWMSKDRDSSFDRTIIVPVTAQTEQFIAKPLPSPPPFFTIEKKVWVSKVHPPASDADVVDLSKEKTGYAYPICLQCRHPEYSVEAVKVKAQGQVVLRVQVSQDGFPAKISLVRGIPCGLTDSAFEAVEHWTFKPATGPDGAPIAVEVPIEVQFRSY